MRRRAALACAAAFLFALCAQSASAAVLTSWNGNGAPAGYSLTADKAIRIAIATPQAQAEATKGGLSVAAFSYSPRRWSVRMFRGSEVRVEVHIDDRSGRVVSAWRGLKANWSGARGSAALVDERELGSATDSLWVWLPLCLLFVLPFVDPKRPLRRAHVDVLLLLGFVAGHLFFVKG